MTGDTGVPPNLVLIFAIYLSIYMIHYFIEITSGQPMIYGVVNLFGI